MRKSPICGNCSALWKKGLLPAGTNQYKSSTKKYINYWKQKVFVKFGQKMIKMARFGHKTATSTFYRYKNHLAITEDCLIVGVKVTPGSDPDGQQLPDLIEKAKKNGVKVAEVIGDMAYVSDENLDACGGEIKLIARTNTAVAAAADARLDKGFSYNKDAGMMQCPSGELAMWVKKRAAKNGNQYNRYVFSKKKCKKCPMKEQCRVGKSKEQCYSVTQVSKKNKDRLEFEASERFQERMKIRHRIEEKNGELKEAHGLRRADSTGLFAMELQIYFTAFAANVKRITSLVVPVTK